MKKKVISILCGAMFVILAGSIYFVTRPDQTDAIVLTNATEEAEEIKEAEADISGAASQKAMGESAEETSGDESKQSIEQISQEKTDVSQEKITSTDQSVTDSSTETHEICIYVCGAVKTPGVYYLFVEARAVQAIDAAGGFTDQADEEYINLARTISDGEKLYVPTLKETEEMEFSSLEEEIQTGIKQNVAVSEESKASSSGKVNINTAGKEELMSLKGIGEAKAESIVSYRETNGPFQSKEDIMNITGIKDALYQKIADYICVTNEK